MFLTRPADASVVRYTHPLQEAEFILRENRFAARVIVDGKQELVHVPNSGRMTELLVPGYTVFLSAADRPGRKTRYDLVSVDANGTLVSVDSRVPNAVIGEAVAIGAIPQLSTFDRVRPEYTRGRSRFDFLLGDEEGGALVEVKGCTLVMDDGMALFPDAPTARGARHVRELADAVEEGMDAFVVIVVQRNDGRVFAPNDATDRPFGDALRAAEARGVQVMAYLTKITRTGVSLADPIAVDLDAALRAAGKVVS
jgi:sugar fermentation stimulation protein A